MTQPGNDDVIKVVYQAVADYSQLLRATQQARTQTRELRRDIDALAGTREARVKVTADTGQARSELAAVLRDVVVRVKVTVDAVAAQGELQRLLRNAVVQVKVTTDALAARTEIVRAVAGVRAVVALQADVAGLRRQIDTGLGKLLAKVDIQLNRTDVIAKMRALVTYLQAMGPVKLAVEISDNGQIRALEERIRRLRAQAGDGTGGGGGGGPPRGDGTPGPAPRPRPSGGGGGGGGGGQGGDLTQAVPQGLDTAVSLIAKFATLGALAVPIAGAAAAAVGTLGATFLSAGAAAGIFGVAAVGQLARVSEAAKAASETGAPLEGELGRVVGAVQAVKARYDELLDSTEKPVFAVFVRGLNIAVDLLDKVEPLIDGVAGAIDDALAGVQDAVNGPGFDEFLAFVDRTGPSAVQSLISTVVDLSAGLGSLLQQFEPFIVAFTGGFAQAGAAFRDWAGSLDSDTGFQDFLDYAVQAVPQVIDLILNLLDAATNIGVALAPLGNLLLVVANGIAAFIGVLNPTVLLVTVNSIIAFAVALKLVKGAAASVEAVKDFSAALPGLAARLGLTAGAINITRVALISLGASLGIGLLLTGISLAVSALGSANEKAAQQTQDHAAAVGDLASALKASGGQVTASVREQAFNALRGAGTEGANGVTGFSGTVLDASDPINRDPTVPTTGRTLQVTQSLPEAAKTAGVDLGDLTLGSIGDDAARARALKGFDDYIAARKARLAELQKNPITNKQQISQVEAELNIQIGARKAYEASAISGKKLAEGSRDLAAATGESATAGGKTTAVYDTQAQAADALRDALKGAVTATEEQTAANNAFAAADAYDKAVEAYAAHLDGSSAAAREAKGAEEGLIDAQNRATDAQDNLNRARADAKQRIIDLQRQLRDLPLDERQAQINVKKSDQALQEAFNKGGVDPLDLEQLQLDNERSHNALNDFEQDKGGKKTSITDELDKGITGNKNLRDALINNRRAQDNVTDAQGRNRRAAKALRDEGVKLKQNVDDTRTAFDNAAGAIGLTEQAIRDLKTTMDKLKDRQVTVTVNTKDAEAKLRVTLQYQLAGKLLAANPDWTIDRALAEAAKQIPTVAAVDPGQKIPREALIRKGMAEGGPAGPVAGAVRGPGTGTSDSVMTTLPVGGPAALSNGEHIVTDGEVKAGGGHAYVEAFRAALRAGIRWAPQVATISRYAYGGPASPVMQPVPRGWAGMLPAFASPRPAAVVPGYAAGGAVTAMRSADTGPVARSVTVNGGIHVSNAVPERASTSLYNAVRALGDPDE